MRMRSEATQVEVRPARRRIVVGGWYLIVFGEIGA